MCSSIFGSKSPTPTPAPPPAAPVEEAVFKPGGEDEGGRKELKKLAAGKKRLQIPLTKTGAKKSVQTGR